ncbi:MAG: hypothetical protein GX424_06355 [Clostridiales bacterium]|nr:hypothetical protein [Clostridiales bacterium]
MKKIAVMILCTAFIVVGLLYAGNTRRQPSPEPSPASSNILYNSTAITASSQESSEIDVIASQSDVYTVKEYQGIIGIFHNSDIIPSQEIHVEVASLPAEDQQLLKKGIRVYSRDKLNSIIEDYES